MTRPLNAHDALTGALLGTAVGDALGLPAEGLSPKRIQRLYGGTWRHRLVLGRGMISDDTEHTLFVAQALLAAPDDPEGFTRRLAWSLRWWFASLPAGVGLSTARACIKLNLGFGPKRSGVFSAGNGPAMRCAPIAAFFAHQPDRLRAYVRASTRLTHTDPKATTGALAVATCIAAALRERWSAPPSPEALDAILRPCGPEDPDWAALCDAIADHLHRNASVAALAAHLGLERGVTGYIYHTVPVVVFAWARHFGDFATTLTEVLSCGGDADTTGAIVGAMAGATTGPEAIPRGWIDPIVDWPRSVGLLRNVADRLAPIAPWPAPDTGALVPVGAAPGPVAYAWPGVVLRNALFLAIVLAHGFRRLAPPYG